MAIPAQCRLFHDSKRHRDSLNLYKDAETNPIIRDTPLTKDSHVLFMPGKYGPEVDIAVKEKGRRNVPFSPHAGMNRPAALVSCCARVSSPHDGDEPSMLTTSGIVALFPPCVGMNRSPTRPSIAISSLPHTVGIVFLSR